MTNINAFLNIPIPFKDLCLIYPPTVREVAANSKFWQYFKILTMSQEEIEDELCDKLEKGVAFPTPFEFLLNNCYHNTLYRQLTEEAFYCFCHTKINFLYDQKMILFGDLESEVSRVNNLEELLLLKEEDFFELQNKIRLIMGEKEIEPPNLDEDPRVKRIKAKARYRDKIKAKKGMGLKLETCIASICCMEMGLNPLNIGEISYASVNVLMSFYQEKEKYETDIRSIQAGINPKKIKPKYWIRNLD